MAERERQSYKVAMLGDKVSLETYENIRIAAVIAEIRTEDFEYKSELLYVCMCKGWAIKSCPCTATFNDLLCYPYS
jgi:hypothetical protein